MCGPRPYRAALTTLGLIGAYCWADLVIYVQATVQWDGWEREAPHQGLAQAIKSKRVHFQEGGTQGAAPTVQDRLLTRGVVPRPS